MSRPPRVVSAAPRLKAKAQAERRARRSRLVRQLLWVLGAAAPVVAVVWLLVGSSAFAVKDITITGAQRLTPVEVRTALGVASGTPLAKVDTGEAASRVRELAPVASVEVARDWPHGLRVTVVERVPVVAVRQAKGWQLLDATGTAFAAVAQVPRGVVMLTTSSPPATTAALAVLTSLPAGIKAQLASVRASTPEQVTLLLTRNRQVLWGGAVDNATKAQATLALLKMPGTVFDVSAPGVVTRR
jgi:cell division protein FtsQ